MERQVSQGVARRIQQIVDLLEGVPAAQAVRERAIATRDDLARVGMSQGATELHELLPALAAFVESSGSNLVVNVPPGLGLPEPALRSAWFACVEGVVNAVKHAPGAGIRIEAHLDDDAVRITIADDGPGGVEADGSGLRGLADRAADVGGSLSVTSGPSGSRLELTLPVARVHGKPVAESSGLHDAGPGTPFLASVP